jgi:hypothetical protein
VVRNTSGFRTVMVPPQNADLIPPKEVITASRENSLKSGLSDHQAACSLSDLRIHIEL